MAVAVAVLFGLMRLSRNPAVRGAATVYVEIFRGTSLLIQLFWIFFVLPIFGLNLDKFVAGFLAVGLNMGAYGAELVRGAILAVPTGQWEAAVALNMTSRKRMWRVILPQAFVIMLPPWGNLVIEILKGTALVAPHLGRRPDVRGPADQYFDVHVRPRRSAPRSSSTTCSPASS